MTKLVAGKGAVTKKYSVFRDIDDDSIVYGDGCHTIFSKLLDRKNYLNRPPNKSNSLKRKLSKIQKSQSS